MEQDQDDLPFEGRECLVCRHRHAGRELYYICVGCPCEARPQPEPEEEASGLADSDDRIAQLVAECEGLKRSMAAVVDQRDAALKRVGELEAELAEVRAELTKLCTVQIPPRHAMTSMWAQQTLRPANDTPEVEIEIRAAEIAARTADGRDREMTYFEHRGWERARDGRDAEMDGCCSSTASELEAGWLAWHIVNG
jgi:hypothetical protein